MAQQQRQTAYKVWLSDLINGNYVKNEGEWESNYVEVKDFQVSRINLVANVVFRFESDDENFCSVTLDDGSETIRVKTWKEDTSRLDGFKVGDIVMLIGRVREYNNEIYLTPEVVNKVENPNWELVRKLELIKRCGKPSYEKKREVKVEASSVGTESVSEEKPVVEEDIVEDGGDNKRQLILELITKNDSEEGVEMNEVVKESKLGEEEVTSIIDELLKEGEIFQPKQGRLKVIN